MQKLIGVAAPITILAIAVTAISAIGQTLVIESEPLAAAISHTIPTRGMTMENVEASYGSPAQKRAPVGDPPITRWEYTDFIVYFEYKRVIHSVPKRDFN